MTSEYIQVTAEEVKRRKAAVAQAEKLARKLGFRQMPARPGYWWHEDIGPAEYFNLSSSTTPVESIGELVNVIYESGRRQGTLDVQSAARRAFGI